MRWTPGQRSPNLEDRRATTGGRRMVLPHGRPGPGRHPHPSRPELYFQNRPAVALRRRRACRAGRGPSRRVPDDTRGGEAGGLRLLRAGRRAGDVGQGASTRAGQEYQRRRGRPSRRDATETGCGCRRRRDRTFDRPEDGKVYIDLALLLRPAPVRRPGDFAQAYVLAHEIGTTWRTCWHTEQVRNAHRPTRSRQRDVGAARAAGRLLCRDVGPRHAAAKHPGGGERRSRALQHSFHRRNASEAC